MQLSVLILVALAVAPAGATYSGNGGTAPLAGGYGLGFNPTYGSLGGFGGYGGLGGLGGLGALGVGFKTTGTFNTGMMSTMEKNLKVTCQKGAMDEGIGITIEEKRTDNIFGAFVCAGDGGTGYAGKADCRGTVVDCCLLGYDSMSSGLPSA